MNKTKKDKKTGFLRAFAMFMVLVLIISGMPINTYAEESNLEDDHEHEMGEWVEVIAATSETKGLEESKCLYCEYKEERVIPVLVTITINFFNYNKESQAESMAPYFYAINLTTKKEYTFYPTEEYNGKWYLVANVPRDYKYIVKSIQGVAMNNGDFLTGGMLFNYGLYKIHLMNGDEEIETLYSWTTPDSGYVPTEAAAVPQKGGHTFGGWTLENGNKIDFPIHPYYSPGWKGYDLYLYASWTEHDHDYTGRVEIAKEPTCIECGVERTYCALDGCDYYIEALIDIINHEYETEWSYDSEYHFYKCNMCGLHLEDFLHEMSEWVVTTPAKFHEDGIKEKKCTICGYRIYDRIPKLSESHIHDFTGKEEVAKEPTCVEEGVKNTYCTELECGHWIEEEIEKIPHKYNSWWEYNAEHHFHTCEMCGVHEMDILHDFAGKEVIIEESTCYKKGLKKIYCAEEGCDACVEVSIMETDHIYGAEWEYDGESHYRICEVCGDRSDEHQHNMSEGVVVKIATETEDGIMEWKCCDCGYTVTEPIKYVETQKPEEPKEEESQEPEPEEPKEGESQETEPEESKEEESREPETEETDDPTEEIVLKPEEPSVVPDTLLKEDENKPTAPYTGDTSPVQMYATLAMIAGFTYILCMFTSDLLGMSQEKKEHIIDKLVKWGKGKNVIIRWIAIGLMFLVLAYYYAIGKKVDMNDDRLVEMVE